MTDKCIVLRPLRGHSDDNNNITPKRGRALYETMILYLPAIPYALILRKDRAQTKREKRTKRRRYVARRRNEGCIVYYDFFFLFFSRTRSHDAFFIVFSTSVETRRFCTLTSVYVCTHARGITTMVITFSRVFSSCRRNRLRLTTVRTVIGTRSRYPYGLTCRPCAATRVLTSRVHTVFTSAINKDV